MLGRLKVLGFVLAAMALGCSSGLSQEDATARCDQDRKAYSTPNGQGCFTDAEHAACVSCYMECGDKCAVAESCPVQYICSGEAESTTGGDTGTGTGTGGGSQ